MWLGQPSANEPTTPESARHLTAFRVQPAICCSVQNTTIRWSRSCASGRHSRAQTCSGRWSPGHLVRDGLRTDNPQAWSQATPGIAGPESDDTFGWSLVTGLVGNSTQDARRRGPPPVKVGDDQLAEPAA